MDLQRGFIVGRWAVDPMTGEIRSGEEAVHLEPKVMDVLVVLAERAEQVVTREELTQRVWGARAIVSDEPLTRCIAQLRQALGDSARDPEYVQTVPKKGYRLLKPAAAASGAAASAPPAQESAPPSPARLRVKPVGLGLLAAAVLVVLLVGGTFLRAPEPELNSLAVLPFGDIGTEGYARGLSGDLHILMDEIDVLDLVSRAKAIGAYDATMDPELLGSRLGVAWLVLGEMAIFGEQIRLAVELYNVRTGRSEYMQPVQLSTGLGNLETVMSGICNFILAHVRPDAAAAGHCDRAELEPVDSLARAKVYNAKEALRRRNIEGLNKAIGLLEDARSLDRSYGEVYALLARAYYLLPSYGDSEPRELSFAYAREILREGAELAPSAEFESSRHFVEAGIYYEERNWPAAHEAFELALAATPEDSDLLQLYSQLLAATGRLEQAVAVARQAVAITPSLPVANQRLAILLTWQGEDEEAAHYFDLALEYGMDRDANQKARTVHYLRRGDYDEVGRLLEELLRLTPQPVPWIDQFVGYLKGENSRELTVDRLAEAARRNSVNRDLLLGAWVYLEEWDRALEAARNRSELEDISLEFLFSEDAAPLRRQSGFIDLLEHYGIVDYWQSYSLDNDFCSEQGAAYVCN